MAEVTDINGVGPAKAETLAEEGYDSVEEIAEADKDELAAVDGVGDDRALEFIVQAQDLTTDEDDGSDEPEGDEFDLTPAEVSDELEEMEEEDDEEDGFDGEEYEDDVEEAEEEIEEEGEDTYEIELNFPTKFHYDVYHAALMRRYETHQTSNQPTADLLRMALDTLDSFETAEYELDEAELNMLHSAIHQQRTNYQGANRIEQADALKEVENELNVQRREYLF